MRIVMLGDARTEHLSRWARHFRQRGDLVLVASANGGSADVHLKLPIRWQALGYPMLVPVFKRMCAEWRPDLVVAHYLPNYGLLAVLSPFRPVVAVGWGSDLLVLPGRHVLQRSRLHFVARRASAFLVDAQMLVEPLVRLGAPVERVYVCPFGVDDDVLNLDPTVRTSRNVPTILSNRRLEARYRVDILLEALTKLPRAFKAQIAHDGLQKHALQEQAGRLGLVDRTTFLGLLDRALYLQSLEQANIYVSTSPTDSTSVSLLEAMAAGLACVVPDIPGNREWIAPGQNGILYAPLNATELATRLDLLLQDPARAATLGARARRTVQSRGRWSHTIRRAELLFTELIKAEPCRAS